MGSKSAELVVSLDSIVTLTHSERQYSSLHLRGSDLQIKAGGGNSKTTQTSL